jgi:hypothetical protein
MTSLATMTPAATASRVMREDIGVTPPFTDRSILERIGRLVAEEEALHARRDLGDADYARLKAIGVDLDRYWDLLRQRRALREFGRDPDEAELRPASVVERYQG